MESMQETNERFGITVGQNQVDELERAIGELMAQDEEIKEKPVKFVPSSLNIKVQPLVRKYDKIGRNEPCFCRSGKKYKNCCMHKHDKFVNQLERRDNGSTS